MHSNIYSKNSRILFLITILFSSISTAQKPIVLDSSYHHDKYGTMPQDVIKQFRAFTSSMDSLDNNDGFANGEALGTPEWVAYEIKAFKGKCIPTHPRPAWKAEKRFVEQKIAPKDNSYVYSKAFRKSHPDWYVRGHLQMKLIAARMGQNAEDNTHTFLNAVPQRSKFNSGIWLDLEYITSAWAQQYGSVWIITGPIYIDGFPSGHLGEEGEFKVAIPDALFKIVVRETDKPEQPDTLAFIYPQVGPGYYSGAYEHKRFLASIDEVELLTGLNFLTSLPEPAQAKIEKSAAQDIWKYAPKDIIKACKKN